MRASTVDKYSGQILVDAWLWKMYDVCLSGLNEPSLSPSEVRMCHALYIIRVLGERPPDSPHGLWASMLAIISGLQTMARMRNGGGAIGC